jgi:hypothetical protein
VVEDDGIVGVDMVCVMVESEGVVEAEEEEAEEDMIAEINNHNNKHKSNVNKINEYNTV